MTEGIEADSFWTGEGVGSLRPDEDLLHRIVDNLIEVHSMPNDFVSVIQPTAAKIAEDTGRRVRETACSGAAGSGYRPVSRMRCCR